MSVMCGKVDEHYSWAGTNSRVRVKANVLGKSERYHISPIVLWFISSRINVEIDVTRTLLLEFIQI